MHGVSPLREYPDSVTTLQSMEYHTGKPLVRVCSVLEVFPSFEWVEKQGRCNLFISGPFNNLIGVVLNYIFKWV